MGRVIPKICANFLLLLLNFYAGLSSIISSVFSYQIGFFSGFWCFNLLCSSSVRSFLWNRRVLLIHLHARLQGVQLDGREPLLHQGQQREYQHRSGGWKIRAVAGRGPLSGPIGIVQDLRQRSAHAQDRLCGEDTGMLGLHI